VLSELHRAACGLRERWLRRSNHVGRVRRAQENIDRNKQALAALFTGVEIMQEAEESPTAPPRRRPKPDPEVCAHATRLPLRPLPWYPTPLRYFAAHMRCLSARERIGKS
jgi:hypothetical protein